MYYNRKHEYARQLESDLQQIRQRRVEYIRQTNILDGWNEQTYGRQLEYTTQHDRDLQQINDRLEEHNGRQEQLIPSVRVYEYNISTGLTSIPTVSRHQILLHQTRQQEYARQLQSDLQLMNERLEEYDRQTLLDRNDEQISERQQEYSTRHNRDLQQINDRYEEYNIRQAQLIPFNTSEEEEDDDDDLDLPLSSSFSCSVCSLSFNDKKRKPRNLPCGHTFCEICIRRLVESNTIKCSICRTVSDFESILKLSINYSVISYIGELIEAKRRSDVQVEEEPNKRQRLQPLNEQSSSSSSSSILSRGLEGFDTALTNIHNNIQRNVGTFGVNGILKNMFRNPY
jgi:hypothetical protein